MCQGVQGAIRISGIKTALKSSSNCNNPKQKFPSKRNRFGLTFTSISSILFSSRFLTPVPSGTPSAPKHTRARPQAARAQLELVNVDDAPLAEPGKTAQVVEVLRRMGHTLETPVTCSAWGSGEVEG